MALPNNRVRIKKRAIHLARLVHSVYNPKASEAQVNQVAKSASKRVIYAPNSGKLIGGVNPLFWVMSGLSGTVNSAKDLWWLATKGRKKPDVDKVKVLKGLRNNYSAPDMSGWFYHHLFRFTLIAQKTASNAALVHELTHGIRGFRLSNSADANAIDNYFVLADKFSAGKMKPAELAELKSKSGSLNFSLNENKQTNLAYKRDLTNRVKVFLGFALDEHNTFAHRPAAFEGGMSTGKMAFVADLRSGKPFSGLMLLKALGEGKSISQAFSDLDAGKYDLELERIHKLNPLLTRHYSRVIKKARF